MKAFVFFLETFCNIFLCNKFLLLLSTNLWKSVSRKKQIKNPHRIFLRRDKLKLGLLKRLHPDLVHLFAEDLCFINIHLKNDVMTAWEEFQCFKIPYKLYFKTAWWVAVAETIVLHYYWKKLFSLSFSLCSYVALDLVCIYVVKFSFIFFPIYFLYQFINFYFHVVVWLQKRFWRCKSVIFVNFALLQCIIFVFLTC